MCIRDRNRSGGKQLVGVTKKKRATNLVEWKMIFGEGVDFKRKWNAAIDKDILNSPTHHSFSLFLSQKKCLSDLLTNVLTAVTEDLFCTDKNQL